MLEVLINIVLEALRVFGSWFRKIVWRESWDQGNDGVDTILGLVILLIGAAVVLLVVS
jgi:hypothetical protein